MKELDRTKAYDLRDLNDEQLDEIREKYNPDYEFQNFKYNSNKYAFVFIDNEWNFTILRYPHYTNALTLFEPQLKIGDTFEKDGFICRVESEVMKWYAVDRGLDACYKTLTEEAVLWLRAEDIRVEEITDQDFIKQLEKHAR